VEEARGDAEARRGDGGYELREGTRRGDGGYEWREGTRRRRGIAVFFG